MTLLRLLASLGTLQWSVYSVVCHDIAAAAVCTANASVAIPTAMQSLHVPSWHPVVYQLASITHALE